MNHSHPLPLRTLHWATAVLIALSFALVWGRELLDADALRDLTLNAHRWIGVCVGVLTVLRLSLRAGSGTPGSGDATNSRVLRIGAGLAHTALYLGLVSLPVLGWLTTSAQGHPMNIAGVHLPMPIAPDPDLADSLSDAHEWLGIALASLVALHLAAVAWHTFWRRDRVLDRMWPRASVRAGTSASARPSRTSFESSTHSSS